jgi:alcohol dehydrogenase YqhD (iron-dependent ADH family)
MWTATWALNTLVEKGKTTDWMVHMLGQAVGAYTNATHGMTLAAVTMPYYKFILPYGTAKFARYAVNVWNVNPEGKIDEQVAYEGLSAMETWMKKIGLVMNITELGATKAMLDGMVKSTIILDGGYKVMNEADIYAVLNASF